MADEEDMQQMEREANAVAADANALFDDEELGRLAVLHERARASESKAKAAKDELAKRIIARMDGIGTDTFRGNGRRLGFRTQTFYGIAEGQLQAAKDFIEAQAPEVNIPASANIKKAVEAYLDTHPGEPIPPFIAVTETRSLVNAKA